MIDEPRQEWDLAHGIPSLSAMSARFRVKCSHAEMQGDPSDKTESQSYCTISGPVLSKTPPMTNMETAWARAHPPSPAVQQYYCSHGTLFFPRKTVRQWRHATIDVPSPCQFNVDRQSVGCICPEKRLSNPRQYQGQNRTRNILTNCNGRQLTLIGSS
jgi:hypothetical protein